jgi:hypothetical protein
LKTSHPFGPRATAATLLLTLILSPAMMRPAQAIPLLGWNRLDQVGSEGSFFAQSGTTSPVNGTPVPAPPGGVIAAMSDALGPGTHLLYQDFVVPTTGNLGGILSFSLFIGNGADRFAVPTNPPTLDFSTPALNQQARVDILRASADPFSVAPGDVLFNAFQTRPGDPLVSGYNNFAVDVSALLLSQVGQTLRLRFAEVDNIAPFQFGVDNVSLEAAPVPEPAGLTLMGIGAFGLISYHLLRRKGAQSRKRGDRTAEAAGEPTA